MRNIYDDERVLFNELRSDIEGALMNEVLDKVKDIEIKHIETEVYSVYSPTIYGRRLDEGGLLDPDNIVGNVKNMELTVENITPFNEDYATKNKGIGLAEMVNEGGNYTHDYDYGFRSFEAPYSKARPFLDKTIDEIEDTESVENALAKGLKNRKYDVF